MLRRARLAALIVAAALQAATPLAAYARVPMLPISGDLCRAVSVAARTMPAHDAPQPRPLRHGCAQSPCCIGTTGAGARPQVAARSVFIEFASVIFPAAMSGAASASIIAAAPPRGPPPLA